MRAIWTLGVGTAMLLACGRPAPQPEHTPPAEELPRGTVATPRPPSPSPPTIAAPAGVAPPGVVPRQREERVEDIERLLLAFLDQGDRPSLDEAIGISAGQTLADPAFDHGWRLLALGQRLAGDQEGEAATVRRMGPLREVAYRRFFDGEEREVAAYLRWHLIHLCMERIRRGGGVTVTRPYRSHTVPLSCGGWTADPATCPEDFDVFERTTLPSRSEDRIARWSADGWPATVGELASMIGIREGSVVADVGAGTGWFTVRFAGIVGPSGRVLAVEIDPLCLSYLHHEIDTLALSNVVTVSSALDDVRLDTGSVDVVFLCDTLKVFLRRHPIDGSSHPGSAVAARLLDSIRRSLAPGGTVVVTDKLDVVGGTSHTREEVQGAMDRAGFLLRDDLAAFRCGEGQVGCVESRFVQIYAPAGEAR